MENEPRKLASIQRIGKLEPIEGADQIEKATVLGWQLVVKKGEFKEGDPCVYCEIDSILPKRPEFAFLEPRHYRIRTIRLKGTVSQGIAFPLSILPEGTKAELGSDVTEVVGVEKWLPKIPANLAGLVKGTFPTWMAKTDELRVQTIPNVLTRRQGTICYVTEKVDGASATFYLKDGVFGVCSRNLDLIETPENAFWSTARDLKIEEKLRAASGGKDLAIQGELLGPGVQNNRLKLEKRTIKFFNVFDIPSYSYLNFHDAKEFFKRMDVEMVPIITEEFVVINDIPELVKFATAMSAVNPKIWREGIVVRPLVETLDMEMARDFGNGRFSFKVINPEYLLAYGE